MNYDLMKTRLYSLVIRELLLKPFVLFKIITLWFTDPLQSLKITTSLYLCIVQNGSPTSTQLTRQGIYWQQLITANTKAVSNHLPRLGNQGEHKIFDNHLWVLQNNSHLISSLDIMEALFHHKY